MPPIKAMPLLIAAAMPFSMTAGIAAAGETPVVLAQFSPQQKDDQKQKPAHANPPPRAPSSAPQAPHGPGGGAPQGLHPQGSPQPAPRSSQPQSSQGQGGSPSQPHGTGGSQQNLHSQGTPQPALRTAPALQTPPAGSGGSPSQPHGTGGSQQNLHTQGTPQPALRNTQARADPTPSSVPQAPRKGRKGRKAHKERNMGRAAPSRRSSISKPVRKCRYALQEVCRPRRLPEARRSLTALTIRNPRCAANFPPRTGRPRPSATHMHPSALT